MTQASPAPDKFADQRPWDGPYEGDPADLNYETSDHCDSCNSNLDMSKPRKLGIMYHARGATGRVCPVLFICHDCDHSHLPS